MSRKLKWLIALAVSGLLIVAIAIPSLAQGPDITRGVTPEPSPQPFSCNCQVKGMGPDEAVTELLGMTAEEIQALRESGKSLVQIAAEKNVTEESLINAILADRQASLQAMVTAGNTTQAQADLMLEQMKERIKLAVNRTTVGPPDWAGTKGNGQKGAGMMQQRGQFANQNTCTEATGTCTGNGGMMRMGRGNR